MKKIFVLFVALALFPSMTYASNESQSQCYGILKSNLREARLMNEAGYLDTVSYEQVETDFSKKYRTMSSLGVGIGIDEPRFATRLYSFGEPTGYIHPVNSFFPDSQKSEQWSTTTKQTMVGEEYIVDDSGVEHFLGCFLISMRGTDLMAVTNENYAGDAPGISLRKTALDKSYKAWYAETPSFDKQGQPLVTWYKLFVYPESAKNAYFNKYDVADAFPAHEVTDFSIVDFTANKLKVSDFYEETGTAVTKYLDLKGGKEQVATPEAILPIVREGINSMHPYATYYQAIQAAFPEFGKLLSVRGTLKINTFFEVVQNVEANPEFSKFLNLFRLSKQMNDYYKTTQGQSSEKTIESADYDRIIPLLQHGDWTVSELKQGKMLDTLTYTEEKPVVQATPPTDKTVTNTTKMIFYAFIALFALIVLGVLYYKLRKTNKYE